MRVFSLFLVLFALFVADSCDKVAEYVKDSTTYRGKAHEENFKNLNAKNCNDPPVCNEEKKNLETEKIKNRKEPHQINPVEITFKDDEDFSGSGSGDESGSGFKATMVTLLDDDGSGSGSGSGFKTTMLTFIDDEDFIIVPDGGSGSGSGSGFRATIVTSINDEDFITPDGSSGSGSGSGFDKPDSGSGSGEMTSDDEDMFFGSGDKQIVNKSVISVDHEVPGDDFTFVNIVPRAVP